MKKANVCRVNYGSGYFVSLYLLQYLEKGSARSLKLVGVEKASALYKFRELAMHRHVGLLTDINGSVTDELPIKYIVSSV